MEELEAKDGELTKLLASRTETRFVRALCPNCHREIHTAYLDKRRMRP